MVKRRRLTVILSVPGAEDLRKPDVVVNKFPDGELHVRIPGIARCRDRRVVLLQRLYPDQNTSLVETILLLDALRSVNAHVTLVAPYLPYARQDKVHLAGEALSAAAICRMLKRAGVERLVTVDCHFLKREGDATYGGLPITNLSARKQLVKYARRTFGARPFIAISPDQGANYMVADLGGRSMRKKRGAYAAGKIAYRSIREIKRSFDVQGKNVLLIDDMISTGGTMLRAIDNLRRGGALSIVCAATHGVFVGKAHRLLTAKKVRVITTDSIANSAAKIRIRDVLHRAAVI